MMTKKRDGRKLPLIPFPFARGVVPPSCIDEGARGGELGSIPTSGIPASLPPPFADEDWKNIGDDAGAAASPLVLLDERGVD